MMILGNGQPWDLDGMHSGVNCLSPYQAVDGADWYSGTANAIFQNILSSLKKIRLFSVLETISILSICITGLCSPKIKSGKNKGRVPPVRDYRR